MKKQYGFRIDAQLMALVRERCERTGETEAQFCARALELAIEEVDRASEQQLFFMGICSRATPEELRSMERHLALLRLPNVRPLDPSQRVIRNFMLMAVESISELPEYQEFVELLKKQFAEAVEREERERERRQAKLRVKP